MMSNRITCEACGLCCTEMGSPPFMPEHVGGVELQRLPAVVRKDYENGMKLRDAIGWPDGEPYFWLMEDQRCKHYQHRPEICREFKVGGEACRGWRELLLDDAEELLTEKGTTCHHE